MAAELTRPFVPAAGRAFVTLTSWAGDASFGVTPVANGQIEGPSTWTLNADGTVTGADGTETLRYIAPSGMAYAASYTITNPDVTAPTISSLVATGTDPDTIDVSVDTNEATGTLYVFASANVSETAAAIKTGAQGSQAVSATGTQTIALTLAVGDYYVHAMHEDAAPNASNVLSSAQITLAAIASSAQVTRPFVGGSVYTVATLQTGFQTYAFEQWPTNEPAVGWQLVTLTADGVYYDSQGNWFDAAEGIYDVWVIDLNGMAYKQTLDSTQLQTYGPAVVPQGTWTIGTITKDQETASFTPTYSLADAASYEYSIGGGAYIAFTGTISLTGLSAEVAYSGLVRAVNAVGNGATQAFSFTTDAVPVTPQVPQGTWTIGTITKGQTTASFTPTYSGTDATSYQYSIGGSAYIAFTGTILLSGLSAEVAYSGSVKAVNGAGDGGIQAFSFTTDAVPVTPQVPQGNIVTQPPVTTQNTAEIYHSYSAGDADSFEYSLDNVNWQAASNPLVLTGLTLNTTGTANFRAVNAVGFGAATSINFRTKGETVIIPSGNWKFFTAVTKAPKTWEWGKRHPITNARVRLFKKGQL
jgi:hypothetical protein